MKRIICLLISIILICIMISFAVFSASAEVISDADRNDLMFAEYAEIGDGVYFDTGYVTNPETTLLMDVNLKSNIETWFGENKEGMYTVDDDGAGTFVDFARIYFKLARNYDKIEYGYGQDNTIIDVGNIQNGRHTIQLGSEGFYLDTIKKYQSDNKFLEVGKNILYKISSQPNTSLYLFGTHVTKYNNYDTFERNMTDRDTYEYVTDAGNVTFYNCRIYDYSELVHDFVPAVIKSNNKSVIYDVVNDTVYEYSIVNGKSNGDASDNVVSYNLSDTLYPEENSIVTNNAGFTLSQGNLTIIVGVVALVVGLGIGIVIGCAIMKKKLKKEN